MTGEVVQSEHDADPGFAPGSLERQHQYRLKDQGQLPAEVDLEVRVRTVFERVEVTLLALLGTSAKTPRW